MSHIGHWALGIVAVILYVPSNCFLILVHGALGREVVEQLLSLL